MQPQQKWEYKVEITQDGVHPADLRTLGAQKWELVAETAWIDPKARGGRVVRSVFKRPAV